MFLYEIISSIKLENDVIIMTSESYSAVISCELYNGCTKFRTRSMFEISNN